MAAGDFTWFTQAKVDLFLKIHDFDSDTIKLGLITSAVTPTETDPAPHWGGTGTTDHSATEVTPGGNYAADGVTLASVTAAADGANAKLDAAEDVSIAQHASNPTNARWAIAYNSTDANKRAIGFLDLGSARDLSSGNFSHAWSANGIARIA